MISKDEDFQNALTQLYTKEKRAYRRSILFTIIPVIVGGLWMWYSFTQVRGFQVQSEVKKNQIDSLEADLQTKKKELENIKKKLLEVKLEQEAASNTQRQLISKPDTSIPSNDTIGWAYYGYMSGIGDWNERYFKKKSKNSLSKPQIGDTIISVANVHLREGFIKYNPEEGWLNEPIIEAIKPNQSFKVSNIQPVLDDFIWVEISQIK